MIRHSAPNDPVMGWRLEAVFRDPTPFATCNAICKMQPFRGRSAPSVPAVTPWHSASYDYSWVWDRRLPLHGVASVRGAPSFGHAKGLESRRR